MFALTYNYNIERSVFSTISELLNFNAEIIFIRHWLTVRLFTKKIKKAIKTLSNTDIGYFEPEEAIKTLEWINPALELLKSFKKRQTKTDNAQMQKAYKFLDEYIDLIEDKILELEIQADCIDTGEDTTELLLTEPNRSHLLKSISQIENGELISFNSVDEIPLHLNK